MLRNSFLFGISILAVAAMSMPAAAQWNEMHKIIPGDGQPNDRYGEGAGIHGNIAIVGSYQDSHDGGEKAGSAYLYDVTTGAELLQFTASDAAAFDELGAAVDVYGDIALVSARGKDAGTGAAYLFDVNSGTELFKLTASDPAAGDKFGIALDLEGDLAIVGANEKDGVRGAAYLFNVSNPNSPVQLHKLTSSDSAEQDRFGGEVAVEGDYAVVGAQNKDGATGAAYIFDVGTGDELFALTSPAPGACYGFGDCIDISGNIAIIGEPNYCGDVPGAAYLYDVTTGTLLSTLTASDAENGDWFGYGVGISGNVAIVSSQFDDTDQGGNSGSAYVFDISDPENPVELQQLLGADVVGGKVFGHRIAIDENNAIFTTQDWNNVAAGYLFTGPILDLIWDETESDWGELIGDPEHSHWSKDSTELPSLDVGAVIDAGICTVPEAYTAEAKTMAVGSEGTLNVNGTLTAGSLTTAAGSTLSGSGTLAATGEVMLDGTIAPGNSTGVLTLDVAGAGAELGDSAVYRCEIGADDTPTPNDVINVSAGDLALGGTLELVATSKLRGPDGSGEWVGEQTRTIASAEGDSSVRFYFETTPTPLPADFGAAEWGEGHIGRGVFLTRENNGGENDVPGVSYSPTGAKAEVHLFQALDGDTNGDMILDTSDIFAILGAGSFLTPGEWDWTEGDFDGDTDVDTDDIFAILATGQWGDFTPYYPQPAKASAAKGEADAVVELLVNPETGEVSVDTHGAKITGYKISSDSGALTGEAATQFALTDQTPDQIADMLPLGRAFVGVHDLGSVLDGDGSDLTLTYTLSGQAGVFQGSVKAVPEPKTLVLLATGIVGLLIFALRKRRR